MQVLCISAQSQACLIWLSYQQCFFFFNSQSGGQRPYQQECWCLRVKQSVRGLQPSGTFFTRPRQTLFPSCVRFDTRRRKECLVLFARGVAHHMASDLTVKGPSCARAAATAQEQCRGSEWKAVHFMSSQALPSMRWDFFLSLAELLLFGKTLDCEPFLHSLVTVYNAAPLSVTECSDKHQLIGMAKTWRCETGWAGLKSRSLKWSLHFQQQPGVVLSSLGFCLVRVSFMAVQMALDQHYSSMHYIKKKTKTLFKSLFILLLVEQL